MTRAVFIDGKLVEVLIRDEVIQIIQELASEYSDSGAEGDFASVLIKRIENKDG